VRGAAQVLRGFAVTRAPLEVHRELRRDLGRTIAEVRFACLRAPPMHVGAARFGNPLVEYGPVQRVNEAVATDGLSVREHAEAAVSKEETLARELLTPRCHAGPGAAERRDDGERGELGARDARRLERPL